MELWLQGLPLVEIAKRVGRDRGAVQQWLRKPAWIAAAQMRRAELRDATAERVKTAVDVAWATLVTICQDTESHEGARVRAAAEILERAGWQPPTEGAQPADAIAKALNEERDQVRAAIEQAGGLGALLTERPAMPDAIEIDPRGELAKKDKRIAELEAEVKRRGGKP